MDIITLDFETFWSEDYTLKKMTTEEYVRDDQFHAHMLGIKVNNTPAFVVPHADIPRALADLQLANKAVLAFNAQFDGFIMSQRYGVYPGFWLDPMQMSYFYYPEPVGLKSRSLKALLELRGLGAKGDDLILSRGVRELPPWMYQKLAAYCANDVDRTYDLFMDFSADGVMPEKELELIDATIRLFTEPVLKLNVEMLKKELNEFRENRKRQLASFGFSDIDEGVKILRKNDNFATLLIAFGVTPEMKESKRVAGKMNYAFAKTDDFMQELLEHENERVATLADIKLNANSSILESRLQRMVHIAGRDTMPVMLIYSKARTGRWGGSDKMNPQNFKKKSAMRLAIEAPEGHLMGVADSSNIEARMLATWAGQEDLVLQFRNKEDAYIKFAIEVFNRPLNKHDNPVERFVGKTCLGAQTLVLTQEGWKRIIEVSATDTLWDGEEWIHHEGVIYQGHRHCLNAHGLCATPDHEVLSNRGWTRWDVYARNVESFPTQWGQLSGNSRYPHGASGAGKKAARQVGNLSVAAVVDGWGSWIGTISRLGVLRDVTRAQSERLRRSVIGRIKIFFETMCSENGYSIAFRRASIGANVQQTKRTNTTARAVSVYIQNGCATAPRSWDTSYHWQAGMTQNAILTESTMIGDTNRVTCALLRAVKTRLINVGWTFLHRESENSKRSWNSYEPVFDIANAGPRRRFTVLTERGPLIVHNCVLGLGYGTGAAKLQHTLHVGQGSTSVDLDLPACMDIVKKYRTINYKIVELWERVKIALEGVMLHGGAPVVIGELGVHVTFIKNAVILPSGRFLHYPNLRWEQVVDENGRSKRELRYGLGRFLNTRIYAAKLVENIVQALSRDVVAYQLLTVRTFVKKVVMFTHDEIVFVHPEATIAEAMRRTIQTMSLPPQQWANLVPLAAEGDVAPNYTK